MDELDLLAAARPVPPPTPDTVFAARSALLTLIAAEVSTAPPQAPPDPGPLRVRRLRLPRRALMPAMAAGMALVLGIGLAAPWNDTPGPDVTSALDGDAGPLPPQKLRNYLLTAANRALQDSQPGGRHWVSAIESGVLIQVGDPHHRYAIMGRYDNTTWYSTRSGDPTSHYQQWIGGKPASAADRAAWQRAGAPSSWPHDLPPDCPPRPADDPRRWTAGSGPARVVVTEPGVSTFGIAGAELTAAQVEDLPTDPAALRDWATRSIRGDQGIRTNADLNGALFSAMLNLLYHSPSPPAVRAAAYRLLADLPGLLDRGTVTDPLGRAGVAFTFTRNQEQPGVRMADSGGPSEIRLIFDPKTGRPLAVESRLMHPADYQSWVPVGALFDYEAVVQTRWTDEAPPTVADVRSEDMFEPETC